MKTEQIDMQEYIDKYREDTKRQAALIIEQRAEIKRLQDCLNLEERRRRKSDLKLSEAEKRYKRILDRKTMEMKEVSKNNAKYRDLAKTRKEMIIKRNVIIKEYLKGYNEIHKIKINTSRLIANLDLDEKK